ncbi:putative replication associated protein [Gigaspora margarita]|uniref:Putative replication associated protein n=1 Tax=Gigaspora margarita TaxID=4874 RepID=A0A8H3WUC7_GIGMA|nr:putative replication associated protein [Gigaspora margarita]
MKQTKKQKINKSKGFDIHISQLFLTYSRCNLTKEELLEYLEKIINKKTEKQKYFINRTVFHPNIQGVRSSKCVIDYILKHEIKEGRHITNATIAKEYPKTFVIYSKRLIDWKIKIEEEHYASFGKPFVEFHYGDKMYGKSIYTEKFNDKIAYRLDSKNWFDGYNKHSILILDDFDGTNLFFSILLKILSGQQHRLEIKGSKELNYIKHMIITSNYTLDELYKNDSYNRGQLDWRIDAIWHYKKTQDIFSKQKYERNPFHKQQHQQYLNSIDYYQYFEENWDTIDNNLNITKNIFHNNYTSIPFDIKCQGGEPNDDYLPIEKIRTILVKRKKRSI